MTAPELMRAFARWVGQQADDDSRARYWGRDVGSLAYPLYIGGSPHNGQWYVRERLPGTRVWRAEEDGGFVLLDAFDMPPRLANAGSLRGCSERDW